MNRRFDPTAPVILGKMPDGSPIWTDPKDLILTGDEVQELNDNKKRDGRAGVAQQLAAKVLENAEAFVRQTIANMFGACPRDSAEAWQEWLDGKGVEVIQDGLTTVVKVKGSEVRKMRARIDQRFAEEAEKFVRRMVASI